MWTGNTESGYPSQWALNPSAYQNVPADQVDWASLAQQWIKMKEIVPVGYIPPAPPPPSIKGDLEAGEAPMDISKDDVTPTTIASTKVSSKDPDNAVPTNWNSWNSWQQWNWGWGGGGAADKSGVAPYSYTQTPAATPGYGANVPTATFDYNHGASVPDSFEQQPDYWSGGPAPFVRSKNSEWRGDSRSSSSRRQAPKVEEIEHDTTPVIDAAKRKQLPNWIREGLEKMEREKQKKLEQERMLRERQEEMERRKKEEEEALASGIPLKSKFDTDTEESDKEPEEVPVKPRKSRFDTTSSPPLITKHVSPKTMSPPLATKRKNREEIMQDVLQQVRYVMTDVLLVVTNDEMQTIAEEVLTEFRAKAPATQVRKTPALTSLTGKLGLGIYDSDSDSSSEDSTDEPPPKKENGVDSDEELRERINRKKQEFVRIERDIEHLVEQQEEREREQEREQLSQDTERALPEDKGQVEPKFIPSGDRLDSKADVSITHVDVKNKVNETESFTPERPHKTEKESSHEQTEDSDNDSYSKTDSSSRSSSSSRHKKAKKYSKKKKEKKHKRKRSSSRGSDRRKSSHKKSSHKNEERYRERHRHKRSHSKSRSRSRSRSRDYYRYRHHSSESSHKRRHHSYSHSPEYYRGKKSSHRSHD